MNILRNLFTFALLSIALINTNLDAARRSGRRGTSRRTVTKHEETKSASPHVSPRHRSRSDSDSAPIFTPVKVKPAENDFFSPQKIENNFSKFRSEIVSLLLNDDFNHDETRRLFKHKLQNFFNTICYPMQMKANKSFYAALFYCIFNEIFGCTPNVVITPIKTENTIHIFICCKNEFGTTFAFEVFIYSGAELYPELIDQMPKTFRRKIDQETRDTLFEEIKTKSFKTINKVYNHNFIVSSGESFNHHLRFYLNTDDGRNFELHNIPEQATDNSLDIAEDKLHLLDLNFESPIHRIIHQLDMPAPDSKIIQKALETFYSTIPFEITHEFRVASSEKFYHALFYSMLNLIRFGNYTYTEYYTKNGRADIVINSIITSGDDDEINRPIVIELKHQGSAQKALAQIDDREYLEGTQIKNTSVAPLKIGINIKSSTKKINVEVKMREGEYKCTSPVKNLFF